MGESYLVDPSEALKIRVRMIVAQKMLAVPSPWWAHQTILDHRPHSLFYLAKQTGGPPRPHNPSGPSDRWARPIMTCRASREDDSVVDGAR